MHKEREYRDYRVRQLSASDRGRGIAVAATGSPGTLIHEAIDSSAVNEWDALQMWAVNPTGSAIQLTLEWGGTATGDRIVQTISPGDGLIPVVSGLVVQEGAEVRAFADASGLVMHGVVNRYSQHTP